MQKRLERSGTDRVFTGVCGGIAEHLAIDATVVRAFFVIAAILTAFVFVLAYITLLILMPLPGQRPPIDDLLPGRTGITPPPDASPGSADPQGLGAEPPPRAAGPDDDRRNRTIGYVLVAVGLLFLFNSLGAFRFVDWRFVWPIALIGLGVLLLVRRSRG
jgi:phage shock protein C